MQKKIALTILFVIFIGIWFFYWGTRKAKIVAFIEDTNKNREQQKVLPKKNNPIKKILLAPRPSLNTHQKEKDQKRAIQDNVCEDFKNKLNSLEISFDTDHLQKDIQNIKIPNCTQDGPHIKELKQRLQRICKENELDECLTQMLFLRSAINAKLKIEIENVSDFSELVDLLLEAFSHEKNFPVDRLAKIARQMEKLHPEYPIVQKISLVGETIEVLHSEDRKNNPEIWNDLIAKYSEMDEEVRNDPSLADFSFLVLTEGMKPDKIEAWANEAISRKQDQAKGYEMLGYLAWKKGEHQAAKSFLAKAIKASPNNEWYIKTMSEISRPDAAYDAYKITMNLGFSLDELLELN